MSLLLGLAFGAERSGAGVVVSIVELTDEDLARIDLHDASTADWAGVLGATPTLTAQDFFVPS